MPGKCIVCGKEKGRNKFFCSQKCRMKHIKNEKICAVCGKAFFSPPSSGKITCSIECEKKSRSAMMKNSESNRIILEKAHIAAKNSPNSAAVETNSRAKSWVIRSPEGEKYEISNLALWARENASIIPGTPIQFADGIRRIKQTLLGSKARGALQYKGWTLEKFFDENLARKGFPESKKHPPRSKMSDDERLRRKRESAKKYYQKRKGDIIWKEGPQK